VVHETSGVHKNPDVSATSDTESEDDDEEIFADVLAHLDKQRLIELAASVRQHKDSTHDNRPPTVEAPMYGSTHVIFPLLFQDGVRWLAKIHVTGVPGKWTDISSRALTAEAKTMRLLKRETTIPLPEVYDFSATTENPLGCPYMFVSHVQGKSLYDVWFAHRLSNRSQEEVDRCRVKALEDIAKAMVQLKSFSFERSGTPTFDSTGLPSGTAPSRCMDYEAMMKRGLQEDSLDEFIYVEESCYYNTYDYFVDGLKKENEPSIFNKGLASLVKLLISCIPSHPHAQPFVLVHPDYNIQNFLVSDDGELQGIIDWDGASAAPRSVGPEGYPDWLTRDWDPMMYGYKASMDEGVKPRGVWEDSPECLRKYRAVYRDMVAKARETMARDGVDADVLPEVDITRSSLMVQNLHIAAGSSMCRTHIAMKIVGEIAGLPEGDDALLHFFDLVNDFGAGKVDDDVIRDLKAGAVRLFTGDY
jgi:hypothetical protein